MIWLSSTINILEGDGGRVGEALPQLVLGLADDDPAAAFRREFRLRFGRDSGFAVPEHLLGRHDAAGQKCAVGFPTLQKTVNWLAKEAFVMKHLAPLSTYFPSSRFAMKVLMDELSEPAPGSVRQKEARRGALT